MRGANAAIEAAKAKRLERAHRLVAGGAASSADGGHVDGERVTAILPSAEGARILVERPDKTVRQIVLR